MHRYNNHIQCPINIAQNDLKKQINWGLEDFYDQITQNDIVSKRAPRDFVMATMDESIESITIDRVFLIGVRV